MPPAELVHELAGNAFSGFQLFPVIASAIGAAGVLATAQSDVRVRKLQVQISNESAHSSWSFDQDME